MNKIPITNFPIFVYGKKERFNDTITKGRCRVFYKGRNRNGTFITDEFAEKLINSAPYTPVKGIYEIDDYGDHGKARTEGRIYGIIPADPNFAWEKHLDNDGIEREYACFDVLYYTALYKEAGEIDGKAESMELYRHSLKGEWKIMDGKKTFVFTEGCFLGLQVLGDEVEPCFEGASFYSDNSNDIISILEKYEKKENLFSQQEQGGNLIMEQINFKVSDSQKLQFLFNLLNPSYNADGGWMIEYSICEVYDEYAIVFNLSEGGYERVFYLKNDETDSLEITNKEKCYIIDVNQQEKEALTRIKGESNYEQLVENYETNIATIDSLNSTINGLSEKNSEYSTKIEELNNSISTLTTERDNISAQLEEKDRLYAESKETVLDWEQNYELLRAEKEELAAYKKEVELANKTAILANYENILSAEIIEEYTKKLEDIDCKTLDMELTYEVKKAKPSLFSQEQEPSQYIPKDQGFGNTGLTGILSRYEKK